MKATIEVPDDLYRRLETKAALEGRAIRDVAIELFIGYVEGDASAAGAPPSVVEAAARTLPEREIPRWFGALEASARRVERHGMDDVRATIARGVAAERAP